MKTDKLLIENNIIKIENDQVNKLSIEQQKILADQINTERNLYRNANSIYNELVEKYIL